jgi:hypothetical protein
MKALATGRNMSRSYPSANLAGLETSLLDIAAKATQHLSLY